MRRDSGSSRGRSPPQAQSDSSQIVGVVKDATGSIVPAAKVSAVNEGTGIERQSTSNAEGYFVMTNLPPGYYTVTVEVSGFKKYVKTTNRLDAATPLRWSMRLSVGAMTESVRWLPRSAPSKPKRPPSASRRGNTDPEHGFERPQPAAARALEAGCPRWCDERFTFGLDSAGLTINGAARRTS